MYGKDEMNELLKKEKRIEAHEIAEQILPLLMDYFAGDFTVEGESLHCTFLNGNKFRITVFPNT